MNENTDLDKKFMREALKEANKAFKAEEVPVGAVLVHDNKITKKIVTIWFIFNFSV